MMAYGQPMSNVGDAFAVPFRDPQWTSKAILQGLIALIPIVGSIALCGWMLRYMDNLREGREELPPAGFPMGRGMHLFIPSLGWGFFVLAVWIVVSIVSAYLGSTLFAVVVHLGSFLLGLAVFFLTPAIISNTWRSGIAGGFHVNQLVSESLANPADTVVAAILILVGYFIFWIGSVLCYFGFFLTAAYGAAVASGAAYWFATRVPARQSA